MEVKINRFAETEKLNLACSKLGNLLEDIKQEAQQQHVSWDNDAEYTISGFQKNPVEHVDAQLFIEVSFDGQVKHNIRVRRAGTTFGSLVESKGFFKPNNPAAIQLAIVSNMCNSHEVLAEVFDLVEAEVC